MRRPQIQTSYFAHSGTLRKAVAITVVAPHWLPVIAHAPNLAPPQDLLYDYKAKRISEKTYAAEYIDVLDHMRHLDPEEVAKKMDGKVLCCYEKSCDFCHRHVLAAWLRHHTNATVREIVKGKEVVYDPYPLLKGVL